MQIKSSDYMDIQLIALGYCSVVYASVGSIPGFG
jgi:hypothetical protein